MTKRPSVRPSIPESWVGKREELKGGGLPDSWHVYDEDSVLLINAAIAVGRPLLLRGEPGSGKSQLARAAAHALEWEYTSQTLDARTEATDLLWHFDAVRRLATAQVLGSLLGSLPGKVTESTIEGQLDVMKFVEPRAMWQGLHAPSAKIQYERAKRTAPEFDESRAKQGWVVLLDEMDKADPSVPNGLLEVLAHGVFRKPDGALVTVADRQRTLVIVTTNEERPLPNAFLRRCLVLQMGPERPEELPAWLRVRARAHFPDQTTLTDKVLELAIERLLHFRQEVREQSLNPPGLAELIDLLRAVVLMADPPTEDGQKELLLRLARFALLKHPRGEMDA